MHMSMDIYSAWNNALLFFQGNVKGPQQNSENTYALDITLSPPVCIKMFTQKSRHPSTFQVITNNTDTEIRGVPFVSISMIYDKMPELQEECHPTSAYFCTAHGCLHLHGTTGNSPSKFLLFHRRNTTLILQKRGVV